MAAQSPYPLLFAILVSHLTSPSHSANTLQMFAVCATWRFAAFPLFVTFDGATKTLLCAFVLSRLDYCNALLAGSPKHLIEILQKVQNHAARLVFHYSNFDHVTPLPHSLHWLPVHMRIDYKASSLCFKILESTAPSYLFDLFKIRLHVYTPSRQLLSSSDDRLFRVPHIRTESYGQRSFAYWGADTWNQLPLCSAFAVFNFIQNKTRNPSFSK